MVVLTVYFRNPNVTGETFSQAPLQGQKSFTICALWWASWLGVGQKATSQKKKFTALTWSLVPVPIWLLRGEWNVHLGVQWSRSLERCLYKLIGMWELAANFLLIMFKSCFQLCMCGEFLVISPCIYWYTNSTWFYVQVYMMLSTIWALWWHASSFCP